MENDYEIPISFTDTRNSNAQSSVEDFVDICDLPRCASMNRLAPPMLSSRNNSIISTSSQQRLAVNMHTSRNNPVNIRRSVSFASCQANRIDRKMFMNDDCTVVNNMPQQSNSMDQAQMANFNPYSHSNRVNRNHSFAYVVSVENEKRMDASSFAESDWKQNATKDKGLKSGLRKSNTSLASNNKGKKISEADFKGSRSQSHSSLTPSRVNLRDSAIDLVSDEENSEAYTAVSLAGTLSRKTPALPNAPASRSNRKFYIIIAILTIVVLILGGLGIGLALALFR